MSTVTRRFISGQAFEITRTPPEEKARRERDRRVAAAATVSTLVLTPFCAVPRVEFEGVKLGKTAERTVRLQNPGKKALKVSFGQPMPKEDRGFEVDYVDFVLPGGNEADVRVGWAPNRPGNVREKIGVKYGGCSTQVVLVGGCEVPKDRRGNPLIKPQPLKTSNAGRGRGARGRGRPTVKAEVTEIPRPENPVVRAKDGETPEMVPIKAEATGENAENVPPTAAVTAAAPSVAKLSANLHAMKVSQLPGVSWSPQVVSVSRPRPAETSFASADTTPMLPPPPPPPTVPVRGPPPPSVLHPMPPPTTEADIRRETFMVDGSAAAIMPQQHQSSIDLRRDTFVMDDPSFVSSTPAFGARMSGHLPSDVSAIVRNAGVNVGESKRPSSKELFAAAATVLQPVSHPAATAMTAPSVGGGTRLPTKIDEDVSKLVQDYLNFSDLDITANDSVFGKEEKKAEPATAEDITNVSAIVQKYMADSPKQQSPSVASGSTLTISQQTNSTGGGDVTTIHRAPELTVTTPCGRITSPAVIPEEPEPEEQEEDASLLVQKMLDGNKTAEVNVSAMVENAMRETEEEEAHIKSRLSSSGKTYYVGSPEKEAERGPSPVVERALSTSNETYFIGSPMKPSEEDEVAAAAAASHGDSTSGETYYVGSPKAATRKLSDSAETYTLGEEEAADPAAAVAPPPPEALRRSFESSVGNEVDVMSTIDEGAEEEQEEPVPQRDDDQIPKADNGDVYFIGISPVTRKTEPTIVKRPATDTFFVAISPEKKKEREEEEEDVRKKSPPKATPVSRPPPRASFTRASETFSKPKPPTSDVKKPDFRLPLASATGESFLSNLPTASEGATSTPLNKPATSKMAEPAVKRPLPLPQRRSYAPPSAINKRRSFVPPPAAATKKRSSTLLRRQTLIKPGGGGVGSGLGTAVTSHPNPFASRNIYYDERWVQKQESGFKRWLNFVLTPECVDNEGEQKLDIAKLWKACSANVKVPRAPTRETLSLRAYAARRELNRLRRRSCELWQTEAVAEVVIGLEMEIEKKGLMVRKDRNLTKDAGLKQKFLGLALAYNPQWLRIGLETVYGEVIGVGDVVGLGQFVLGRMLSSPDILAAHAHPTVPHLYKPGCDDALKQFALKKFLQLVFFLDLAKSERLLRHNPCLFRKDSKVKESRQLVISFSREFLAGEGDIIRHLACLGYEVGHKQTALDEFDYAVTDLQGDLRDGVRLCRVVEFLCPSELRLTDQLRVPAGSRLQKIHNVELALSALREATGTDVPVTAKDVADGNLEKVLSLMWHVVHSLQIRVVLDEEKLRKEVDRLRRSLKFQSLAGNAAAAKGSDFVLECQRRDLAAADKKDDADEEDAWARSELMKLLLWWARLVCAHYNIQVDNLTVSFSDGRALCLLVHHYVPSCLARGDICQETTLSASQTGNGNGNGGLDCSLDDSFGAMTYSYGQSPKVFQRLLDNEKKNFKLFHTKTTGLGGVPMLIRSADMSNTIPDKKVTATFLAYLAARLIDLSADTEAAVTIQRAWRRRKEREREQQIRQKFSAAAS